MSELSYEVGVLQGLSASEGDAAASGKEIQVVAGHLTQ